jgi:hypothetical protein
VISAGTTTKSLVGFFLYIILYLPVVIWIKPHRLERWMWYLAQFLFNSCMIFASESDIRLVHDVD